ncbi:MAG: hypothetical protein HYX75_07720 [Acidobacteria bacterium]|nr:hypothetical protein [Acidobacteriota bacterium]
MLGNDFDGSDFVQAHPSIKIGLFLVLFSILLVRYLEVLRRSEPDPENPTGKK